MMKFEAVMFIADQPDGDGKSFTKETLELMAKNDPDNFRYEDGKLYHKFEAEQPPHINEVPKNRIISLMVYPPDGTVDMGLSYVKHDGEVTVNGALIDNLHENPLDPEDPKYSPEEQHNIEMYNTFVDGITSLIIAHACVGVDVQDQKYIEGIKTALESYGNNT